MVAPRVDAAPGGLPQGLEFLMASRSEDVLQRRISSPLLGDSTASGNDGPSLRWRTDRDALFDISRMARL